MSKAPQQHRAAMLFYRIINGIKLTNAEQDELLDYIMKKETQEMKSDDDEGICDPFDASDRMYENEILK